MNPQDESIDAIDEDEERELDRLVRFLTRPGPRFGLGLAIYRDPIVAQDLRRLIQHRTAAQATTVRVVAVGYEDRNRDLVARMADACDHADGLMVHGFDSLLVDSSGKTFSCPAIHNLNGRRDSLPSLLDARVVLWISRSAYDSFRQQAWDLHEVMLTICEFERVVARPQPTLESIELPTWFATVPLEEALALRQRALTLTLSAEPEAAPRTRADASASAARVYLRGGWFHEALRWLDEAARTYETIDDLAGASIERRLRAEVLGVQGELDAALDEARRAKEHARDAGSELEQARATQTISELTLAQGHVDDAVEMLRSEVLPAFERAGAPAQHADATITLARMHRTNGRLDEALVLVREQALPEHVRIDDTLGQVRAWVEIAAIREAQGQLEQALHVLQDEALPLAEQAQSVVDKVRILGKIADIFEAQQDLDRTIGVRLEEQLPIIADQAPNRDQDTILHKVTQALKQTASHSWTAIRDILSEDAADPPPPNRPSQQLVDELARVFHDRDQAVLLATRAGFPRSRIPNFTTSHVFWSQLLEEARSGALAGGVQPIIDEAARMYPDNSVFARAHPADPDR